MSFLEETLGATNLRFTGYVFVVIGIIMVISSMFKKSGEGESDSAKIKSIEKMQISSSGFFIFGIGLLLVSTNR